MHASVKALKVQSTVDFILSGLTLADLETLNCAMKSAWSMAQRRVSVAFRTGDKVSFRSTKGPFGGTFIGRVTKVNPKTIRVTTSSRNAIPEIRNWVVSPSMLTKVSI